MKNALLCRLWLAWVPCLLSALAADPLTESLQRGLLEEEVNRDLEAAAKAYETAVKQTDAQRQAAATAVFRLGEVYRKLGRTNDAIAQYRRVLDQFADLAPLAGPSRTNLLRLESKAGMVPAAAPSAGTQTSASLGAPTIDPADAESLREEIGLVEQELLVARKKFENGKAEEAEVRRVERELLRLQRKLPEHASRERQVALLEQELKLTADSLTEVRKKIEVGAAAPLDEIAVRRELLGVQRELAAAKRATTGTPQRAALLTEPSDLSNLPPGSGAPATAEEADEIKRIQTIIQNSPDLVNARNATGGRTPLHKAAADGYMAAAEFLLANKADVNAQDSEGSTPLSVAAGAGHKRFCELLLARGADVHTPNQSGYTPLHRAVLGGYQGVAETLIAAGARVDTKGDLPARSAAFPASRTKEMEVTPLHSAAERGFPGLVELLLRHGADINAKDRGGRTPLMRAIVKNQSATARRLLEEKADPNVLDAEGMSALFLAVVGKQEAMLQLLLDHQADLEARLPAPEGEGDWTVLFRAVWDGEVALTRRLLDAGAFVNARASSGITPVHWAAIQNRPTTLRLLLERKIHVNPRDSGGNTPLHYALEWGLEGFGMLEALLAAGADPNAVGWKGGWLPLVRSIGPDPARWPVTLAGTLLKHGADANAKPTNGWSALHRAVQVNRLDLAELLVTNRAALDARGSMPQGEPALGERTAHQSGPGASPSGPGILPNRLPPLPQPGMPFGGQVAIFPGGPSLAADTEVTPLHVAVANQNLELSKFLLDRGADVNARDAAGRAPIHFAVNRRDLELTRLLLDAKADPNAKDASGQTALALAGAHRDAPTFAFSSSDGRDFVTASASGLIALLRERGARPMLSDPNAVTVSRGSSGFSARVLTRGSRDWNQFTLLELIAIQYGLLAQSGVKTAPQLAGPTVPEDPVAFPDLARIRITRPLPDGGERVIPVDLSAAVKAGDCDADVLLAWGDVVELPEEDHPLNAKWVLSDELRAVFKNCLERKVDIVVKGERETYELQLPYRRDAEGKRWVFDAGPRRLGWDLGTTLDRSGRLRTSSDLSRVLVQRIDPATGMLSEWQVDCTAASAEPGLWLRAGDVVEVPDKADAAPAPGKAGVARVLGEVMRPGTVPLDPDRPKDIIDAIAESGGLTDRARPQIEFTRAGVTRKLTLDELKAETDPAQKIWLEPGDLIEAKRTNF